MTLEKHPKNTNPNKTQNNNPTPPPQKKKPPTPFEQTPNQRTKKRPGDAGRRKGGSQRRRLTKTTWVNLTRKTKTTKRGERLEKTREFKTKTWKRKKSTDQQSSCSPTADPNERNISFTSSVPRESGKGKAKKKITEIAKVKKKESGKVTP